MQIRLLYGVDASVSHLAAWIQTYQRRPDLSDGLSHTSRFCLQKQQLTINAVRLVYTCKLYSCTGASTQWVKKLCHGWLRCTVVERRSLAGELSLSCARPVADGWPLMWVNRPLEVSQLGQLSLSSFRGGSSLSDVWYLAQVAPSGECLRFKSQPGALSAASGSFFARAKPRCCTWPALVVLSCVAACCMHANLRLVERVDLT